MNDMAKIVRSHDGQSVELPEGYRFAGSEVRISREGGRVVLESIDDDAIDAETGLTIGALRALVQEGVDSGDDGLLDMAAIKGEARAAWQADRDR